MILDFVRDEAEDAGRGVLVAAAAAETDGVEEGGSAVAVETTVATEAAGGSLNLQNEKVRSRIPVAQYDDVRSSDEYSRSSDSRGSRCDGGYGSDAGDWNGGDRSDSARDVGRGSTVRVVHASRGGESDCGYSILRPGVDRVN